MNPDQPPPTRECGDCNLCCKTCRINEIDKPGGTWCPHATPGEGCDIYGDHPDECRSFSCLWRDGILPEHMRPDRVGLVLALGRVGTSETGEPVIGVQAWERDDGHLKRHPKSALILRDFMAGNRIAGVIFASRSARTVTISVHGKLLESESKPMESDGLVYFGGVTDPAAYDPNSPLQQAYRKKQADVDSP